MAQKAKQRQIAVRLTAVEYEIIARMINAGLYRSSADFARDAIRDKIRTLEVVGVKEPPVQEAKRMILAYLKKNPGSHFTSDIADKLGMSYHVAFRAVKELLESDKVRRSKVQ